MSKTANPIIYIMGVSGSGKTTIGQKLSETIGIPFFDGDDYHPRENKDKMSSGHPLTDEDRQGWLLTINELAITEQKIKGAIIACSALKEKYRVVLSNRVELSVKWVMLQGSFSQIKERLGKRQGHFMPDSLLNSQFDTLELPINALRIDIALTPAEIVEQIVRRFHLSGQR